MGTPAGQVEHYNAKLFSAEKALKSHPVYVTGKQKPGKMGELLTLIPFGPPGP